MYLKSYKEIHVLCFCCGGQNKYSQKNISNWENYDKSVMDTCQDSSYYFIWNQEQLVS